MPSSYTNIAKPTSSVYTGTYVEGKQIYDQADIEYDQSNVAYDSVNDAAYTNLNKPTGSVYTAIVKPT